MNIELIFKWFEPKPFKIGSPRGIVKEDELKNVVSTHNISWNDTTLMLKSVETQTALKEEDHDEPGSNKSCSIQ